MKRYSSLLASVVLLVCTTFSLTAQAPCTINNGIGCECPNPADTNCVLLPDITISWFALENYDGGPSEYAQNGGLAEDGQLRLTGSTPNIGYGPFTVLGTDYFICGTDTIYDPTRTLTICPNGDEPTNLLHQRIYSKNGNGMTYEDIWAGGQTYHPGHGHNHVDDWVVFTLRQEDPNQPDTLQWPIIADGAKIGFCLMDLSNCDASPGHCRTSQAYGQGVTLTSADFPNYRLGGGNYSCNPVEQGISVGYVDIYSEYLDGMYIEIPPGTCNGDYWIVVEVDPRNNFRESNENNNWTAIPFTLTKQVSQGNAVANITTVGGKVLCNTKAIELRSNVSSSYLWSTGETTSNIFVTDTGYYYVDVDGQCGSARSDTIHIGRIPSAVLNVVSGDTICPQNSTILEAQGNGTINWFAQPTGGQALGTGESYNTGLLSSSVTYYVSNLSQTPGPTKYVGPATHAGTPYSATQANGALIFSVLDDIILESVLVFTDTDGQRLIELKNASGTVLYDTLVQINTGATEINLGYFLTPGTGYQLGTNISLNNNLYGGNGPLLKRSDTLVTYPYFINGDISITGSNVGSSLYYYFYNWKISEPGLGCESDRIAVPVTVEPAPAITVSTLDTTYFLSDNAVVLDFEPTGGVLTGPGTSTNSQGEYIFTPLAAGVGNNLQLSYAYNDGAGCVASQTYQVRVKAAVSVETIETQQVLNLYPNPTNNTVYLQLDGFKNVPESIRVINLVGQEVFSMQAADIAKPMAAINLSSLQQGMYLILVKVDGQQFVDKVILE